jgi:(S)-2-hydroxyglutarate dehydrogenase
VRVVVVGAGIIGLAAARAALERMPDAEVVVLEKENGLGLHQTSHNSGVVHAGVYYTPGSLKARLCRRGAELLRNYCSAHGIRYEECGKVVVATTASELDRLREIARRAEANGVPGARLLDQRELRGVEPHVSGIAALHSPTTAVVDFAEVARSLAADAAARGAAIRLGTAVTSIQGGASRAAVRLADGSALGADRVLVCAGLWSDRLARASGRPADPRIVPFRGEYYALRPRREALVRGHVYPVPDPALPFLGVHLTRTVSGGVLVGPSAALALALGGYQRRDVALRDMGETWTWPGTRRMAARHWRSGALELARSASKRLFLREVRRYVPALTTADVVPAPAGVRAQAVSASGALLDDFAIDADDNVIWLRNAPSPGATASMAIAEELAERLLADTPAMVTAR